MALLLLAHDWACARDGRVTALTVDHGLRVDAAAETAQTADWCRARGIAHETLLWNGPHPATGIQEEARRARYGLLEEWCRSRGVLHLLIAHQCEDQAETLAMRLQRSSGVDGLAGMAAVVEKSAIRILRPLLSVPRARLKATLATADQSWIDDPSNRNLAYLRAKLRARWQMLENPDRMVVRLATLAPRFGAIRRAREADCARLLARSVMLHPAGFAVLDPAPLRDAPEEGALKAMAAILTTVAGTDYPPRRERLERLVAALSQGLDRGRTLGGCLLGPRRGKILICREAVAAAAPILAKPGTVTRWDGRFALTLDAAAEPLWVGALGADLGLIRADIPATALAAIPPAARRTLPALRDAKGVVAVPALRYFASWRQEAGAMGFRMEFHPTRPLADAGFTIV
jgi:tRNA(Ile)-lysidine synthase